MSLITVDPEKCKRDGICVAECPMSILFQENKEAVPAAVPNAGESCIHCGHCVAVCPHGALSLEGMPVEDCPPVRKEWLLSPEHMEHFLRGRRSIRRFKDKPVERRKLEELMRIASFAQSGHNSQPVQWLAVYEKEKVHNIAGLVVDWMRQVIKADPGFAAMLHMDRLVAAWDMGLDFVLRGAPHLLAAHAPKDSRPAPVACHIALTYAELAAPSLGMGTCWAGFFQAAANLWAPLQEALRLPDYHEVHGGLMVGLPQFAYHRLPLRNAPKVAWI